MFRRLRMDARLRDVRKRLAACFVAAFATIFALPAQSGIKPIGEQPIAMRAAEAYYNYFSEHVPGVVEPLIDYSEEELPPLKCDLNAKPKVHAILIGASDSSEPFGKLAGPDNDVDLLYTSLTSRGAADDDIALMVGEYANREALAEMFLEALGRVNCGDRALVHFGGNSIRSTDIVGLVPDEVAAPFKEISVADIWDADFVNDTHEPTRVMRWAQKAGLYLALNKHTEGVVEIMSARDISEFVTNLRNRQVDVAVTLDTSYASEADIVGLQDKAGGSAMWNLETSGADEESVDPADYTVPTPLQPNRGQLAVFYSSIGDSHSIEFSFGEGEDAATYGVFTFRLANVIQNHDSVTIRAMAESLKKLPTDEGGAKQRYRVESTDPDLVLFADATLSLPQSEPIVITKPTPKRGAATMEKAEVEIEGSVNWSSPAKAVLVDGKVAELKADNTFRYTSKLKAGLNTVEVVALTADGRTHEKRLEFVFEGDKKALEGEGKRYAVIIANQTYDKARSGFAELRTPFADADAVTAILTGKYGFVTEAIMPKGDKVPLVLKDATRHDIETVLYKIGLVAGEKDTVLIYYAGHGIYEEKTTIAFWVPVDAEAGVPISYLSASTIAESVQRMQAGKVVIISDSCFSGALLRGGGEGEKINAADRERALLRLAQRRTRILISSGNNEPVEDTGGAGHSVFARALLTGLEDMSYEMFSARELFDGYVLPLVAANADQEPQYRPIERSGHEGGDIVFVRQTK